MTVNESEEKKPQKKELTPEEKLAVELKALGFLSTPRQKSEFERLWRASEKHARDRFLRMRKPRVPREE